MLNGLVGRSCIYSRGTWCSLIALFIYTVSSICRPSPPSPLPPPHPSHPFHALGWFELASTSNVSYVGPICTSDRDSVGCVEVKSETCRVASGVQMDVRKQNESNIVLNDALDALKVPRRLPDSFPAPHQIGTALLPKLEVVLCSSTIKGRLPLRWPLPLRPTCSSTTTYHLLRP